MPQIERRECKRFKIPGATVVYKISRLLLKSSKFTDNFLPIHDLSLGGIRFLSQDPLKVDAKITVKIIPPGDETGSVFEGRVMWITDQHEESYAYLIGVQFNPYGNGKGMNAPENLSILKDWQQQLGKIISD